MSDIGCHSEKQGNCYTCGMAESDVEKIKEKLSINDVVGQYVQLRRAGRNYTARCPFHKEKTPSFMVSPERGTYMCFGCGEKGDIFSFVQKIEGIDFPTALRQLADKAGVTLTRGAQPAHKDKEKEERLADICEAAAHFFESQLHKRKDIGEYVRTRGVHDDTAAAWRIGYAPASWRELSEYLVSLGFHKQDIVDAGLAIRSENSPTGGSEINIYDRFRGRIMFPLFDTNGKVIAFSGRFFEKVAGSNEEGEPAKYVNSPETALFKKSRVLYGLNFAKNAIRKADCILLVEGQFDVVMSHQSGLPFTVAISGTALTPEHLSLLGRFSKRLVLALDADSAGIRAGLRSAAMAYAQGFDVKVPTFPEGKDPADVAKENPELLKAAIRTSKTAIEFFLDTLRHGAKDERAYKKLVEAQVLPLIAAIQSSIEKEHFIALVARRLMVSEAAVRIEVAKRPTLSVAESESTDIPSAVSGEINTLHKAAGMLLFGLEKDEETQQRLRSLLGEERVADIKAKLSGDAERLRFTFDTLGGDTQAATEAVMETIERFILEDEMNGVNRALRSGEGNVQELLQRLYLLKKRQQELYR